MNHSPEFSMDVWALQEKFTSTIRQDITNSFKSMPNVLLELSENLSHAVLVQASEALSKK